MTEPTTIRGSVEIRTNSGESTGVEGQRWSVDTVPLVLGVLHGITDMASVEPVAADTGRVPEAQWEAVDAQNQQVTVHFWPEVPYEETYAAEIGPQLVADDG